MANSSQQETKAETKEVALVAPNAANISILYSALDNYGGYPFADLFDGYIPAYAPADLLDANGVLVIWGGADISPAIYNQTPGSHTHANDISSRDQLEINLIGQAIKMGMPMLGICRGAQLLCAMAGGTLVQDVTGHYSNHEILTDNGRRIKATSLHHQMMFPWHTDHKLIAWTAPPISTHYYGQQLASEEDEVVTFPETVDPDKREPEIVYFPRLKALAIQGHPEFIHNEKHEFVVYCRNLVNQYLLKPFVKSVKK